MKQKIPCKTRLEIDDFVKKKKKYPEIKIAFCCLFHCDIKLLKRNF